MIFAPVFNSRVPRPRAAHALRFFFVGRKAKAFGCGRILDCVLNFQMLCTARRALVGEINVPTDTSVLMQLSSKHKYQSHVASSSFNNVNLWRVRVLLVFRV